MSLNDAIAQDMQFRATTNAANDALLETLPEHPERGSYYWWANVCRENTGQALCDSGIAYGYAYNAPVPPEDVESWAHFYNGKLDGASINTIKWLTENTDADDETAEAIEQILHWLGRYLYWDETWSSIMSNRLIEEVDQLLLVCEMRKQGTTAFYKKRYIANHLEFVLAQHTYSTQRPPEGRQMSDEEYLDMVLKELPVKAVKHLYYIRQTDGESIVKSKWSGGNTYSHENDFSQDFQFHTFECYGETYAIIEAHCGCDIRGGYATPVVTRIWPHDGFFDWTCDVYCASCGQQWEMIYFYLEQMGKSPLVTDEETIRQWEIQDEASAHVQVGQMVLPEMPMPEPISETQRMLIASWYTAQENEDEFSAPHGVVPGGDPEVADGGYDVADVTLLCPYCRQYAAVIGVPIYH